LEVLTKLMGDADASTRLWAARYCLDAATAGAEAVLIKLAQGEPGPLRLAAEMTIAAWRKGELDVSS
jgi:hypothetical protein